MGAPKGNKYAVGNSGRPKTFETPEILQENIEKYYKDCEEKNKPLTIEGLCVFLGITRQTLLNYEKNESYFEFFDVIKIAKQHIMACMIENMLSGKYKEATGIFLLKNHSGYTDKQEVEHSGETSTTLNFKIDFGD